MVRNEQVETGEQEESCLQEKQEVDHAEATELSEGRL